MDRNQLSAYLSNQNVLAFLRVIREGESGQNDDTAYRMRYTPRGTALLDRAEGPHPRIAEPLPDGSGRTTSSFGAYQFVGKTWAAIGKKYGLPDDITPAIQDLYAVALLVDCGAMPAILAGDFEAAVAKAGPQWASLPGSSLQDGGSKLAMARAANVWARYGGGRAADVGVSQPAAPEAPTASIPPAPIEREPSPMINPAILLALAQSLLKFLPAFSSGSAVATRNIAVTQELGEKIIEAAQAVTGPQINEQAAVEAIHKSPELQEKFTAYVAVKWSDFAPFVEATEKSRAEARSFAERMTDGTGPAWRSIGYAALVGTLAFAIVIGGGWVMREVLLTEQAWATEVIKADILGYYKNIGLLVVGFVFGSSYSSHQKDVAKNRMEGNA